MARLLISGASGLVGKIALWHALDDARVDQVVCLGRRPLPIQHPKLEQRVVDFAAPLSALGNFDAACCALGTTMRIAGSQAAFRAVDHGAVLAFARAAKAAGVRRFALVSSVGANVASGTFYLAVKGEAERDLADMNFPDLTILRPGLIIGARAERRPLENLAQKLAPLFDPVLLGQWRRYRSITAQDVALALLNGALQDNPGGILEHDAIRRLALA